jgi:AGZA family xanthine/uracil permease-like MFS transporter
MDFITNFFDLTKNNTTIKKELLAGLASFLAISYIIIVNPKVLAAAGMPVNALVTSTIIIAAIASISMGVFAKNPFVIAPGMGINVFFSYTAVGMYGIPWQTVLGATLWSGIIFILLVVLNVRAKLMLSLPNSVKSALGAGVGLFIAYIGFVDSGFITTTNNLFIIAPITLKTALFLFCLILLLILFIKKAPAPILIVIIIGYAIGYLVTSFSNNEIIHIPSKIFDIPDFSLFMQLDMINGAKFAIIPTIFTFMFLCLFDSTGTIAGLYGSMNKKLDQNDKQLKKTFLVDATNAGLSGIIGTSPATVVVESGVGIAQGGRTGLTAVFAGMMFLPFLFLAPLISSIPMEIVAPSLILIGIMMMQQVTKIQWEDLTQAIPAFFTILMMIMSSSISTGIACGILSWFFIALFCNRKEINPMASVIVILCAVMLSHTMNVF